MDKDRSRNYRAAEYSARGGSAKQGTRQIDGKNNLPTEALGRSYKPEGIKQAEEKSSLDVASGYIENHGSKRRK